MACGIHSGNHKPTDNRHFCWKSEGLLIGLSILIRWIIRDCRLMFSIWPKQPTGPIRFCFRLIKSTFFYLIPFVSAGLFVDSLWQRHSSPVKARIHAHVFVSGCRQLCSLLYPVRQLHHVCRVDAEEDVQDFRQLRPGLNPPQVVVLFLYSERADYRAM